MSALVHCDGPSCESSREADLGRLPRSIIWIRVKAEPGAFPLDFCSKACVIGWAELPSPTLADLVQRGVPAVPPVPRPSPRSPRTLGEAWGS